MNFGLDYFSRLLHEGRFFFRCLRQVTIFHGSRRDQKLKNPLKAPTGIVTRTTTASSAFGDFRFSPRPAKTVSSLLYL